MRFLDFLACGETPISMAEAATLLPARSTGKHLSTRTIESYIVQGFGPADQKVFLEGARVANNWATSREAISRFLRACTESSWQRLQGESRREAAHA